MTLTIDKIPKELLIEIFNFLPNHEILQLTLVCKHFNDIINDSSSLRKKFRLNLNSRRIRTEEWVGSRIYPRVMLRDASKKSLNIMKKISKDIVELRLMFGRMYMKSLKKILMRAKSLKYFSIVKTDFVDSEEDYDEVPVLELKSLSYNGGKNLFRLLKNCSVKELSIYSCYNTPEELNFLRNFLKSQTILESLEFTSFEEEFELFDDEQLTNVNFRLKKLSIDNLRAFDLRFFKLFLLRHKNSLEELQLKQDFASSDIKPIAEEIFDTLKDFNRLKSMSLLKFDVPKFPFVTVTTLTLQKRAKLNFSDLFVNFPNVKSLSLYSIKEVKGDFTNLNHLESFRIEGATSYDVKLPELKSASFADMKLQLKNLKTNKLIIDDCEDLEELLNYLKSSETQLNLLRIENCKMTMSQKDFITSQSEEKVRNLIFIQCSVKDKEIDAKKSKMS